jgi:hypothetical protein
LSIGGPRTGGIPERGRFLIAAAGALFALVAAATRADAEPTAAEKETARTLMAEGRELRDRKDVAGALQRFRSADAIMHVPTTGLEVARTQAALGQLVEARETLHKIAQIPEQPTDPAPFETARVEADKLDADLERRIGVIRFEVRKSNAAAAPAISIDGTPVSASVVDVSLRCNPGHHVVQAKLGSNEIKQEVDVREADAVTVLLDFSRTLATPDRRSSDDASRDEASGPGWPVLPTIGFGVAAAGVALGTATGIMAIQGKNSAETACVSGQCPPVAWSDVDRMNTFATVSTVSFVVGGAGLACGIASLVLTRPSSTATATSPAVGVAPAPRGLSIAGRF